MKYQHRQNGKVMEILKQDDKKGTMLIQFEDGKSTSITSGTFKRWYKKVEEEVSSEETPVDTVEEKEIPVQEDSTEEVVEPVKQETEDVVTENKSSKSKKEKVHRVPNPEVTKIIDYVLEQLSKLDSNIEVFTPEKAPKVRAFKLAGHMFARMNISTTHVSICCRTKAVSIIPTKFTHHMFDGIYEIRNLSNLGLIDALLKSSFEYQKNKNTHKKEEK